MINAFWPWLQDLASNRDQRPDEWARVIEYFYRLPPIGRSRSYIEKLLLLMADPSIRRSFEDDKQIRLRQNRLSDVALSSLMFSASPKPDDIRHEQSPSPPLANESQGVAKRGRCLAPLWPAILEHLREQMDNGRPCPTYAAIQDKFKCTSTPVGRAFKEGRNEPAFERWCELGAVAQAEPEVLEDPELLAAFNEYAGAMKLTSDARAEGWQNLTKAPRKRQRELIDCMKKELSRPDE